MPTGVETCPRCKTRPVRYWVQPAVTGAVPVELALCDCDYPRCPTTTCKKVLRGLPMHTHTCPHCKGRL